MPYQFERSHYRIEYPVREYPRFVSADGPVWPVDNCSERGFRYLMRDQYGEPLTPPRVGVAVRGRLEFRDGAVAPVAGTVVRAADGRVAVRIDGTPVPLAIIWSEQRYLLRHYPQRFGDEGGTGAGRGEKEEGSM